MTWLILVIPFALSCAVCWCSGHQDGWREGYAAGRFQAKEQE